MSGAKGPLLLVAGGCAAMLGAAALTVSLGSFFSDLPTTSANAASVSDLPVKKVKTVTLKPQDQPSAPSEAAEPKPAPKQAAPARPAPTAQVPAAAQAPAATQPRAPSARLTAAAPPPAEGDELHQADPRWARNAAAPRDSGETERKLESAYAEQGKDVRALRAEAAASGELAATGQPFAMLGSPEDEQIELEPTVDDVPSPAPRGQDAASDDDKPQVSGRTVTVNDGVNMRSAPRSGSGVLTVIPRGARVIAAPGCEQWCRVSYNGRSGYIYRTFIGAPKARTRRAAPARQEARQQQPQQQAEPGLFGNAGVLNNSGTNAASQARSAASSQASQDGKPAPKVIFEPSNR